MNIKLFFILIISLTVFYLVAGNPIVQLPNGQIRGRQGTTFQGNIYYGFEKVPYAAPPTGELRFKAPQPPVTWNGIRDTVGRNISCFQQNNNGDYESEDCLVANIYTTVLPHLDNTRTPLPVMFFIHGGGYVTGSSMSLDPENLLDEGVIVITINYRLGPFGFLSTEDEVIPGNNGLKDQQRAIQWTYQNIALFGGDPKMITIFGQSAGSSSVTYQLLNRANEGMIKGAICESGSYLSPWSFQRNAKKIAFQTAAVLNDTFLINNNSQDLLNYLMNVSARDLDTAGEQIHSLENPQNYQLSQGYFYAPVIEVKNEDAFITRKMYGMLQAGNFIQVPTLMGINSEEMLFKQADADVLKATMALYDSHPEWLVPWDMLITDENKMVNMGLAIKNIYTGGELLAEHLGDGVRYYSDNSFTRSVIKYAELASQFVKLYFYQFSYDGEIGGYNISYPGAEHVSHNEDLNYIFGNTDYSEFSASDQLTQQRIIKIWTNFAKYQNPTPETSDLLNDLTWPLISTKDGDFLYVNINESLQIENHPKKTTYSEWVQHYDSLTYDDFDTY